VSTRPNNQNGITVEDISALAGELELMWAGKVRIEIVPDRAKSGRAYWWLEARLLRKESKGSAEYPFASATVRWPQWSYKSFYGCMYAALWDLNSELERLTLSLGGSVARTIVLAALPEKPK